MEDYYVYQWVDRDLAMPFYVGKGRDGRITSMRNRSQAFKDYLATHSHCEPEIVVDGLSEDDAFEAERLYISECRAKGAPLVNIADGGRGGIHMFGEDNPMSGRPWYTDDTPPERIAEWRRKIGRGGEQNPMWGISPSERMDADTYQRWRDAHRKITGEKNPNYGNHALSAYYQQHPDVAKEKQGRQGIANGRCRPVRVVRPDGSSSDFGYIYLCAQAMAEELALSNVQYLATKISECAKSGRPYRGYCFTLL